MSYGIPQDLIPLADNGRMKNRKTFLECLEMRIRGEELVRRYNQRHDLPDLAVPPISYAVYLTRNDVLMGKGKPINRSSGNMMLHEIVDSRLDQYHQGSRKEKHQVLQAIYDCVLERNGRFLSKEEHGVWLAVDFDAARDKIFRTLHHRHKNSSKLQKKAKQEKGRIEGQESKRRRA